MIMTQQRGPLPIWKTLNNEQAGCTASSSRGRPRATMAIWMPVADERQSHLYRLLDDR